MRSETEIVEKMKATDSFLGSTLEVLAPYLSYQAAKQFLKPEATEADWHEDVLTREAVLAEMGAYMKFAWGKVESHRGISANRSVEKMEAWVWLLGDDATLTQMQAAPYAQYGAPQLKVVCEAYGLPMPDDEQTRRMMRGEPCEPDCEQGCGA